MRDLKPYARHTSGGWMRELLLLAVVFAFPFFLTLGSLPLIDPDEGRYAEIPREMLERGDLITPTLNYVKYFEKPPLLYWMNAASIKLFGQSEFAARFPSALCGLLTVLATYVIARHLYGRRSALLAALILGTSAGFVMQSRIILTDMLLTFCLTAALGSFIVATLREGRRSRPLPWYLFYFFSGLAVLAKGLIGMVFPAGIIFFYLLLGRRWHLLREMRLVTGLMLFCAVTVPWFVAVSLKNPEFAHFFFIREHFQRFTSTVHGRYQPFWYFVPVLLGTMLPWSFFIIGALGRAWRDRHHEEERPGLFLVIWTVLIFLFFSKSSSKLVPYILPIFPPLAILIARRFDLVMDGKGRAIKSAGLLLGVALTVVGGVVLAYGNLPEISRFLGQQIPSLAAPLDRFVFFAPRFSLGACLILGGLFLLQGIGALASAGRNPSRMLYILVISAFFLGIFIPILVMPSIAGSESHRDLALKARSLAGPETALVTVGPMQAVSWYTGRRVMVTGDLDELTFGSQQGDQRAWFPDREALVSMWGSQRHVLLFIKKNELQSLRAQLKPEPVVKAETRRYTLVSNR